MTVPVLRRDGLTHWIVGVRTDGSSEGVDYEVVHVYCGPRTRFQKGYIPQVFDVPTCLFCITVQSIYVNAQMVMKDARGDEGVAWLDKQMGVTPL